MYKEWAGEFAEIDEGDGRAETRRHGLKGNHCMFGGYGATGLDV